MKNFKKRSEQNELTELLHPKELEEIEKELQHFLVKYPDEQAIEATIDTLRPFVPVKKAHPWKQFFQLIKHAGAEIQFIHPLYWIISAILYIVGFLVITWFNYDAIVSLFIIMPISFIFGLFEMFKGRETGMLEMEMACKFSAQEVLLSRLFLIGTYNIVFNTLLTIGFGLFFNTENIFHLLLCWFTPFTLFASISLWLSMKLRGKVFYLTLLTLWGVISGTLISQPSWLIAFTNVNFIVYLLLFSFGIWLLIKQIRHLLTNYSSLEGAVIH